MADQLLSAVLDGECSSEELDRLLDAMERDPALKASFSRLCLAREALHGTRVTQPQRSICDAVMAQLDEAPLPVSDRVSDLDRRRRQPALSRWRPLAGLAAAAAVGALAVLVTVPQARQAEPINTAAGGATMPVMSQPVSLPAVERPRQLQMVSAQVPGTAEAAAEDELSNYLMEHSNSAAGRGMGGTLSYARFAAHNAAYRPQAEEQR